MARLHGRDDSLGKIGWNTPGGEEKAGETADAAGDVADGRAGIALRAIDQKCVDIDEQQLSAKFSKGVLSVKLPKMAGAKQRRRTIEISTS